MSETRGRLVQLSDTMGDDSKRTSSTLWMHRRDEVGSGVAAAVVRRIHDAVMIPPNHGEELQIARYVDGQRYEFHHDTDKRMGRLATVLIYLTTPGQGGATIFPFADLGSVHDSVVTRFESDLPPPLDPWDLSKPIAPME